MGLSHIITGGRLNYTMFDRSPHGSAENIAKNLGQGGSSFVFRDENFFFTFFTDMIYCYGVTVWKKSRHLWKKKLALFYGCSLQNQTRFLFRLSEMVKNVSINHKFIEIKEILIKQEILVYLKYTQ